MSVGCLKVKSLVETSHPGWIVCFTRLALIWKNWVQCWHFSANVSLALHREHQNFAIADLPDIFRHFLHDEVLTSFLDHLREVEEDAAKTGQSDVVSHQICIRADEDLAIVPFFGEASE
jgi:hypothetical protein